MYIVSVITRDNVCECAIGRLFYTLRTAKRFYEDKAIELVNNEYGVEVEIVFKHSVKGTIASTYVRRNHR